MFTKVTKLEVVKHTIESGVTAEADAINLVKATRLVRRAEGYREKLIKQLGSLK